MVSHWSSIPLPPTAKYATLSVGLFEGKFSDDVKN